MVKDVIVIYKENETVLILIRLKHYFSHPEKLKTLLKSSLTLRRYRNCGPWPNQFMQHPVFVMVKTTSIYQQMVNSVVICKLAVSLWRIEDRTEMVL